MTPERYQHIMSDDNSGLTEKEFAEGWHFCAEWDGLLVGPGMAEQQACTCFAPTNEQEEDS